MSNLPVAETILEQLGGRKFIAMTGAKNFVGGDDSLFFQLPGGGSYGINRVTITLEPSDTYTMLFARARGSVLKVLAIRHNVCFDALQEVFTRETGLDTHL